VISLINCQLHSFGDDFTGLLTTSIFINYLCVPSIVCVRGEVVFVVFTVALCKLLEIVVRAHILRRNCGFKVKYLSEKVSIYISLAVCLQDLKLHIWGGLC
jgi:hypothetical protein